MSKQPVSQAKDVELIKGSAESLQKDYLGYDAENKTVVWRKPAKEFAQETVEGIAKAKGLELTHDQIDKVDDVLRTATEAFGYGVATLGIDTMKAHKDVETFTASVNFTKSRKVTASVIRDHDVRIPGRGEGKEATVEVRHGHVNLKTDISLGKRLGTLRDSIREYAEDKKIAGRTEPLKKED